MSNKTVYLVAYYMIKPKHKRVGTQVKGWMSESDNVAYDEQIAVATKLKTNDLQTAKIILDLSNRTVYRNSWNNGKSFDDLFEHFYTGYQKYLDPVINQLGYEMVENVPETATETAPDTISSQ
jgi:hypothetical protein